MLSLTIWFCDNEAPFFLTNDKRFNKVWVKMTIFLVLVTSKSRSSQVVGGRKTVWKFTLDNYRQMKCWVDTFRTHVIMSTPPESTQWGIKTTLSWSILIYHCTTLLNSPHLLSSIGSQVGAASRYHPKRYPQGVHGEKHVHLPSRVLHEDYWRHLCFHVKGKVV